jgi:FAD dependent monooxygenase
MIYPGVSRVFDQFGILQKIQDTITPIQSEVQRWPDGTINIHGKNLETMSQKFDMPLILFDRQKCVTHLYDGLPDKSFIRTNARVDRIEHTDTSVKVYLTDGTYEEGDIVIGADGVHSVVRQMMWDYAAQHEPDAIPDSDKTAMYTQYKGMFGVSSRGGLPSLGDADVHTIYGQDVIKLLFTQPGVAYWGISFKDEYSKPPKAYRPDHDEQESIGERLRDIKMTDDLTFGQLWENRTRYGVLNIEEGILEKWYAGRIVLVGDSAHKVCSPFGVYIHPDFIANVHCDIDDSRTRPRRKHRNRIRHLPLQHTPALRHNRPNRYLLFLPQQQVSKSRTPISTHLPLRRLPIPTLRSRKSLRQLMRQDHT